MNPRGQAEPSANGDGSQCLAHLMVSPCAKYQCTLLSLIDNHPDTLSGLFQAFADPTRRFVLARLARGSASVSDLARPFDMALPSFMKHIRFLERSNLILTRKVGRVRTCEINRKRFSEAESWFTEQRILWEGRADRLEEFVIELQQEQRHEK
jgi:DNA-binding transcriptional ArsR family regulator